MAKLLIFLACVILVLNGMTFLLVVELEREPQQTGAARDLQLERLDSLAQSVGNANRSISQMAKNLAELDRKLTRLNVPKTMPSARKPRKKYPLRTSPLNRAPKDVDVDDEAVDKEGGGSDVPSRVPAGDAEGTEGEE